jgi:hypothetical protein
MMTLSMLNHRGIAANVLLEASDLNNTSGRQQIFRKDGDAAKTGSSVDLAGQRDSDVVQSGM